MALNLNCSGACRKKKMCQETMGLAYKVGGPPFFYMAASLGIFGLLGESNHSEQCPLHSLLGVYYYLRAANIECGTLRGESWVALNRWGSTLRIWVVRISLMPKFLTPGLPSSLYLRGHRSSHLTCLEVEAVYIHPRWRSWSPRGQERFQRRLGSLCRRLRDKGIGRAVWLFSNL